MRLDKQEEVPAKDKSEVPDRAEHEGTEQKQPPLSARLWAWIKRERFSNLVIAAFTVVIGLVGIAQWAILGGQLEEMRSAQRGYIAVEAVRIKDWDTDLPIAIFKIANQGHSPALHVRHSIHMGLVTYPVPNKETFDETAEPDFSDGTLFNGSPGEFYGRIHLVAGDRELLKKDRRIYAWGTVKYETMGEAHHTEFCYVYGGILEYFAEHCPVHNDSN